MIPLCRSLRWRGQAGATFRSEAELTASLTGGGPFTCARTCQPWGPDDDLVSPESCDAERPCYRRSPKVPPSASIS
tara:strand:+ start:100 stop:327 length:228 start_codon:yes stop_codon:yes gene_type:complete